MKLGLQDAVLRISSKRAKPVPPPPLLIELFTGPRGPEGAFYERFPFRYLAALEGEVMVYRVWTALSPYETQALRDAACRAAEELDPREVDPLSFERLIEVLTMRCAAHLAQRVAQPRTLPQVAAYEAVGMSRMLALAMDECVTEAYVDSDTTPLYVDHSKAGRCETSIILTRRERKAVETHLDTFRGYSADYTVPSLKNDLLVGGARLRVSLDLPPVAVNRFSLDIRRLNVSTMTLPELVERNVISAQAASLLLGWLAAGGNLVIVGETGTGKTTLLNALDAELDPRLRRIYIEDAVETRELLDRGFHQVKLKVDPLDRGGSARTKETETIKALHRSPDLLVLSEVQSKEHSGAFFQALAAGLRGIQTFHASTVEQAVRRWVSLHQIPLESMWDLGVVVQMARPDRLRPERHVSRVCEFTVDGNAPRVRDLYVRDRNQSLVPVGAVPFPVPPPGVGQEKLERLVTAAARRVAPARLSS